MSSGMILVGTECDKCRYCTELEEDKNKVYCGAKDKTYYIGACIPCDLMEVEENNG